MRLRGSNVSDTWRLDHPWASIYSFGMARPVIARTVGAIGFGTSFQGLYDAIGAIADVAEGGTVLDVPCGSGIALRGLQPSQHIRYVAADISPAMLRRTSREAERRGLSIETLEADVTSLPFEDATVDLCLSLTALHCFPDPREAVAEIARVTRDRIELTWLRADAGVRYLPVMVTGRVMDLLGPSATAAQVETWLDAAGFDVRLQVEGAFAYATARRR